MALIDEMLAALKAWGPWKKFEPLPDKVEALEKRIAALEVRPQLPICEARGIGNRRLIATKTPSGPFAVLEGVGLQVKLYRCDHCGMETEEEPVATRKR